MGIPSVTGDFPFSSWKIAVFSSAKVIFCNSAKVKVSFLLSSFVILDFRGFNSFSCFWAFVCALV